MLCNVNPLRVKHNARSHILKEDIQMKKYLENIADSVNMKANAIAASAQVALNTALNDVEGSDTTEKIGMVVVAVVVVGLLAKAMKSFMPTIFNSIGSKAQQALEGLF